jgi:membrane protein required for colicin V production
MNIIDIVLILLLLTGGVRGFLKGFIFEIAVIGALFLGTYAAFKLSYLVQPYILKIGSMNAHTVSFVSSLVIFLLVGTGIFFLAKLFEGLVKIAALGIFNKILGAVFGLLKYAFILSVILFFFNPIDAEHHFIPVDKKADSKIYYPLSKIAPALLPVMKEVRDEAEKIVH